MLHFGGARNIGWLCCLLITGLAVQDASGQDRGNPGWYARIAPYVWFSNIGGSVTLGIEPDEQVTGDFLVPVADSVLGTDWAVRLELGKGRIRALANVSRAQIANGAELTRLSTPTVTVGGAYDLTWYTGELFAAVQVGSFVPTHAVEIYAGGRYVRQRQILLVEAAPPDTVTETWIDPVVGARGFFEMGRRFWATINGDLGGFTVGSDFTWTLGGEFGVRVAGPIDVTMRYQYRELIYDNEQEGPTRFAWDNGAEQGWFFGAVLKL